MVSQPDLGVVDNATCAKAVAVPLVSGKAQITGDTQGAPNEYGTGINCGTTSTTYNGQQRYYKFTLKANASYRFTFTDSYQNERMYIFRACGIAQINTDCGSGGKTGDTTTSTAQSELLFTPPTAGDYIVAIDAISASGASAGAFTLTVQEFVLPTNTTCSAAQQLTLAGGKANVSSTSATSTNEFGTQINCGSGTTVMSAPQLYYKIPVTAGKSYRVSVTSHFPFARFYGFGGACTPGAINSDCGSSGATGFVSGVIMNNQTRSEIYAPSANGTLTIAVDSSFSTAAGDFDLEVEEFKPPTNMTCTQAQLLTLVNGAVTVKATTLGTSNEFGTQIVCNQGGSVNMAGPQVYYEVAMKAGQAYRLTLKPAYPARWYLFGSTCTAAAINAACATSGIDGDLVQSNQTMKRAYTPPVDGTYTIAVDSRNSGNFGDFVLTIEEFKKPTNETCAAAQTLTLVNGKAAVKGSTFGTANEFGNQIRCNQPPAVNMAGPQIYYKVALAAGKSYKLTLKTDYPSRWYLFGDSCVPAQINSVCATSGIDGDLVNSTTVARVFTPPTTGTYTIAIDSRNSSWFGDFDLAIEEFTLATNGTCATAQVVTALPAGQTTTITGDTTGVANEFGFQINCQQGGFGGFDGPQLYYRLALDANRTYGLAFTPAYSGARLYLARDNCSGGAIDADCASTGLNGALAAPVAAGQTSNGAFKPTTTGNYLLIVDGNNGNNAGSFKIDIQ